MGRPNRDFGTDDRFHVINRGVDSQDLFSIEDDRVFFESLIASACDNYGFRLNAYALMSNHFHFLVDLTHGTDRSVLSVGIGVLQSTYAQYFNDRTKRHGPLFEPRFSSFGADGDTKTHRILRYIHRNPIAICGPRALGAYRWSSLPVYLGRRMPPTWLDHEPFAPNDSTAYLADLAGCHVDDFLPLDSLHPQRRTTIESIEHAVRRVGPSEHTAAVERSIIFLLAIDLRAGDVREIADRFDRSVTQVRRAAGRARLRRCDDPTFSQLVDRILVELTRL